MTHARNLLFGLLVAVTAAASAEEEVRTLNPGGKQVQRLEVSSSFGGYRDTLIFYTFAEQKAVLKVVIDNKSTKFPVSGTLYVFADNVTPDGLKKWLNNQHSDGLFVDVPEPVAKHAVPPTAGKAVSHQLLSHTRESFGEFDNYAVAIQVSNVPKLGSLQVKDFSDKATVHVKTN